MDVEKIRRDFPILATGIVYFDNAASSLTPEPVLDKMNAFYHQYRANIERGVHQLSQKASEEYEHARNKIATFIHAKPNEIIMTKNTTEGINTVSRGLKWNDRDNIVTTNLEHHSNFIVWLRLKERYGVDVNVVKASRDGTFNLADFEDAIDDQTKLVALTHASNVLGTITPVKEIIQLAHDHGALTLIDGAQSVPHIPMDVKTMGCDCLAFSGHKMCGPTGIGVLYICEERFDEIDPLCIGGGTIRDVGLDYYHLAEGPQRFEAGTPPIAEAIGLGAAADYLSGIGMETIRKHDVKLIDRMYNEMIDSPQVQIYGPEPTLRVGILSFTIEGFNPHDVALFLDAMGVMVRSGAHCALPLMKDVIHQPSGTVRASTYFYNTKEEVNSLLDVVSQLSNTPT